MMKYNFKINILSLLHSSSIYSLFNHRRILSAYSFSTQNYLSAKMLQVIHRFFTPNYLAVKRFK